MNLKAPIITAIACLILSGCQGFNYKNACWQSYKIKGMCGTCIRHHCEDICSTCKANEPQCTACWSCIAQDGCMESAGTCQGSK